MCSSAFHLRTGLGPVIREATTACRAKAARDIICTGSPRKTTTTVLGNHISCSGRGKESTGADMHKGTHTRIVTHRANARCSQAHISVCNVHTRSTQTHTPDKEHESTHSTDKEYTSTHEEHARAHTQRKSPHKQRIRAHTLHVLMESAISSVGDLPGMPPMVPPTAVTQGLPLGKSGVNRLLSVQLPP